MICVSPSIFSSGTESSRDQRCVSVDGDADRVMYFYNDKQGGFNMLDGDRIATLSETNLIVINSLP